jgi:transcriptional regulator with XRE-family HTH domain
MRAGRPLDALDPGASGYHALGAEVQQRRVRAGLSQELLAAQVACSRQHLGAVERGAERPSPALVEALDLALRAGGVLVRRYRAARAEHIEREREECDMERRAFLRVGMSAGAGLIATSALGWPAAAAVGPDLAGSFRQVTLGLRRLDDLRGSAAVMPLAREHLALVLDAVADTRAPSVRAAAADAGQLLGWLAFDQARPEVARLELRRAAGLARAAGDQPLAAYVVAYLAILEMYGGDARRAVDLATAASHDGSRATAGVRSWLATVLAEAHAAAGDELAARSALDLAEGDLDLMAPGEDPGFVYHYGRDGLTMVQGSVYLRLGQPERARDALRETIRLSAPDVVREQAVYGAQLARTYALEGEVDEAVRLSLEALEVAGRTGSARGVQRVREARSQLDPWATSRAVRELDDCLAAA